MRHGESEMNVQGLLAGSTETPLTARGRRQARRTGEEAKTLQIDHIISSPQSRAHQTAVEIAEIIGYPVEKIELNELLVERDFGKLEGVAYHPSLSAETTPGAETRKELRQRLEQAWQYLQTIPADNILVVTHGSTGRMLRTVVHPHIPFHGTSPDHHFPNAEIVQLL